MKIMSFNIKHIVFEDILWMWKNRYKKVVDFIKQENPDILGVQELTKKGKKYFAKKLQDYNIVGEKRHSVIFTNEYNCILIKKEYEIISHNTYSLSYNVNKLGNKSKNDKFPRICVVAHIIKGNNRFMIVNTHIDNSSIDNKKRLLSIYKNIVESNLQKDEYVILLGDYNMTINNKNLLSFSKDYIDPFKDYQTGSYPSSPNTKAIDHIFLDKRLKVYDDKIHTDSNDRGFLSDHNPISCNVKIKR